MRVTIVHQLFLVPPRHKPLIFLWTRSSPRLVALHQIRALPLKQFSEEFGRDMSTGLLGDINARAGLPEDANSAESTTEATATAVGLRLYSPSLLSLPLRPPLRPKQPRDAACKAAFVSRAFARTHAHTHRSRKPVIFCICNT